MALATTPTLAGNTLPPPSSQPYTIGYKGGSLQMADGSIVHDLVEADFMFTFRLSWRLLTSAEMVAVRTAYAAVKDTTGTYLSIENASATVTRPEGGEMEVEPVVTAAGEIAFNVSIVLQEVP